MIKLRWGAIATLAGLIIGAGMLGLPFAAKQSGLIITLMHILLLGAAVLLTNLYLGDVSLKVKENHQLPGLAERFLGKFGKYIVALAIFIEAVGALTAYLIGEGNALGQIFGVSPLWPMLIFFAIMGLLIYLGLNIIEKYELYLGIGILAIFVVLAGTMLFYFNPENLTVYKPGFLFYPYGLVLFAMSGIAAIPELKIIVKNKRKELRKVIMIGTLIPIILFLIFTFTVFMALGNNVTEMATLAFSLVTSPIFSVLGNLLAIFVMASSFLVLGLALRDSFYLDYKWPKILAWIITMFVPLAIVFLGVKSFATVLQIAGAVSGSLLGVLIVAMHRKAVKKSYWFIDLFLVSLYVVGFVYTFMFFI